MNALFLALSTAGLVLLSSAPEATSNASACCTSCQCSDCCSDGACTGCPGCTSGCCASDEQPSTEATESKTDCCAAPSCC